MKKNKKTVLLFDILIMVVLVVVDQLTKNWATMNLKDNEPIDIIKGVLELYYLPQGNTGAAFGLLQGQRSLFLTIAVIVVLAICYLLSKIPLDKRFIPMRIFLVFIAAGGIGNMIDRAVLNYVVDFIYFSIINFPIFNVADIYVTVATTLMAIFIIFYYKEEDIKAIELFGKKNQ